MHWVFITASAFSSCREQGLLFVMKYGPWSAQASVIVAHGLQWLWYLGLVAPRHVESSRSRDQTHIPCIGNWIFNHCNNRQVQNPGFDSGSSLMFLNNHTSSVSPLPFLPHILSCVSTWRLEKALMLTRVLPLSCSQT